MNSKTAPALAGLLTASLLFAGSISPAQAANERPGQFCAKAKIGKTVKSSSFGKLKCVKNGDRARWKRA